MEGMIHKTSKFEVKESNDDNRTIKGYASVFSNLDSDNDIIKSGAFKKTIKEMGPEGRDAVKLCAQHDLGRPVAKMISLKEDSHGLYMEAKFGTHRDGEDYYRMAKEGIINEFSVGFGPVSKEDNSKGGYDFSEVKLYEVSMVTIAANDQAVVTEVKSATAGVEGLIKQVKDKDLAFKLEKEFARLIPAAAETTTEPTLEKDTQPEVSEKEETFDHDAFIKALIK